MTKAQFKRNLAKQTVLTSDMLDPVVHLSNALNYTDSQAGGCKSHRTRPFHMQKRKAVQDVKSET